jgi:lipoprotein-releasing system ATP-binding protein
MSSLLKLETVGYHYGEGAQRISVLQGVSFELQPGEMVALMGPSGSGKSTLLNLCGLLDSPKEGSVTLLGDDVAALSDHRRTRLRCYHLGFVYQFHHLLPEFSALENVVIPQRIAGVSLKDATSRASDLLERVGLSHRTHHRPSALSGGEQQRVAIARALANRPDLLLADEPTGNLDEGTGQNVFDLFRQLARDHGLGVLMATHNPELAQTMDRRIFLHEGHVTEENTSKSQHSI